MKNAKLSVLHLIIEAKMKSKWAEEQLNGIATLEYALEHIFNNSQEQPKEKKRSKPPVKERTRRNGRHIFRKLE